jgi:uncharacterized cupin superfamily protein
VNVYNLFTGPAAESDPEDPPPYQGRWERLGPQLGAQLLGGTLYELAPGQAICPYHYEYAEEEWLVVLEGRPAVRHPEGTDQLEPWDAICFPTGPEGAHAVRNETDQTVRVLMFSTVKHPAATVYPDSDKIGIWTGNKRDDVMTTRSSAVDYWFGETAPES